MSEALPPATLPARSNGKHPGGRPTKKTPQMVAKIADAVASGLSDEYVAALVGIDRPTLSVWRNDPEFSNAIKSAEASRLKIRLARIESGADGWQGTAWFVERKYPQEWSRPELQIAMNVQHSGAIDHKIAVVTEAELRRMTEIRREIEAEIGLTIVPMESAA
jgi:hypothetical protein